MKVIKPSTVKPTRPSATKFTGGVWHEELLVAQQDEGTRAHRFSYDPGAHSHWHTHVGEQVLVGVSGTGLIKCRNGDPLEINPGELIYLPEGEEHWHGATPSSLFVHLAFTASGGTRWLEEVTPEEYASGTRDQAGRNPSPGA